MASDTKPKRTNGDIPFRLRLRDSCNSQTNRDFSSCMESLNLSCIEERWNAFLNELIEADKLPEVGTKSANKPFIPNSLEKQSTRPTDDNWNRPVWIAHLKVWLSPSKVKIFEKHWRNLLLTNKFFVSDPAPHIPRCAHYRSSNTSSITRHEGVKKNAVDAPKRLMQLKEKYEERQSNEIAVVRKRMAEFKKIVGGNRNGSDDKKRLQAKAEDSFNNTQNGNFPKKEKQVPKKRKVIDSIVKNIKAHDSGNAPQREEQVVKRRERKRTQNLKTDVHLNLPRRCSRGSRADVDLKVVEDIEEAASESVESPSPELPPVELPEWVKEYLAEKQKALKALREREQQQNNTNISINIVSEYVDEGQILHEFEGVISDAPHITGIALDSTAEIMSQILPYPIGIETGEILNSQITSSTDKSPYHRAYQARLNNSPQVKNAGAWCPKKQDIHQWLQVDMEYERKVVQIATQGMPLPSVRRPKDKRWVEAFSISYSKEGENWQYFCDEDGKPKVFIGNHDLINTSKNSFPDGLLTRFIRIHPLAWHTGIALRIEIYVDRVDEKSNDEKKQNLDDHHLQAYWPKDVSDGDESGIKSGSSLEQNFMDSELVIFEPTKCEELIEESSHQIQTIELFQAEVEEGMQAAWSEPENLEIVDATDTDNLYAEAVFAVQIEVDHKPKNVDEDKVSVAEEKNGYESRNLQSSVSQQLIKSKQLDRKRVTFKSAATRSIANPDVSSGLTVDDENEDKDQFLSKYCILKDSQKLLYSKVFQKIDLDCDGLIDRKELMSGLKSLNLNTLKETEMNYIMKIIDVFEERGEDGVDQKAFNVIAAFSDRLKHVDSMTRDIIRSTSFASLYLHAHKTRDMFERMLERGENTISSDQFLIELEAAGLKSDSQEIIRKYMNRKKCLDFLDFAIYFPLFLYTHEQIMSTPL